jgi:UDP-glucose 4-epimerase
MKVLVTGSSGRVGYKVVDQLLARGDRVRGFDLKASDRVVDGYDEVVGALDDELATGKAFEGVNAVIHLAAMMSWLPEDRPTMFSANVEGTRVLLEAAVQAQVGKLVFASSGEVYPENAPVELPITEMHPLTANSPYGLTKLLGEELVRFYQRNGALDTVILRFSHTQDAGELLDECSFFSGPRFFLRQRIKQQASLGNLAVAKLLEAADPGYPAHILARNEKGRPYQMHITDTRDISRGVLLALDRKEANGQAFNLGSTEPVDFTELLTKMSSITGYPVVPVDLPGDGVFYHTSNEKIRARLGYEPVWTIDKMFDEAVSSFCTRRQR